MLCSRRRPASPSRRARQSTSPGLSLAPSSRSISLTASSTARARTSRLSRSPVCTSRTNGSCHLLSATRQRQRARNALSLLPAVVLQVHRDCELVSRSQWRAIGRRVEPDDQQRHWRRRRWRWWLEHCVDHRDYGAGRCAVSRRVGDLPAAARPQEPHEEACLRHRCNSDSGCGHDCRANGQDRCCDGVRGCCE